MCMSTVTWQAKSASNPRCPTKWRKGYKVLEVRDTGITFPYFDTHSQIVLMSVLKAKTKTFRLGNFNEKESKVDLTICARNGGSYLAGFHIFPIKKASSLYKLDSRLRSCHRIFEVEYRRVTAEGTHSIHTMYPADCVIAQEMRVIRQLTDEEHIALSQGNEVLTGTNRR